LKTGDGLPGRVDAGRRRRREAQRIISSDCRFAGNAKFRRF
jgi:hypothetical protein